MTSLNHTEIIWNDYTLNLFPIFLLFFATFNLVHLHRELV
jgi:hypothetical protein